jgi:uncharacterized protein YndB with AHSA1/START domain
LIHWKLHLSSPPARVYDLVATDEGRGAFWAQSARERAGYIEFEFPGGSAWRGRVLAAEPPGRFALVYFGERSSFG